MEQLHRDLITYFMEQTNSKLDKVELKFDTIDHKLDKLLEFKWKLVGASVVGSTVMSIAVTILMRLYF